jgi:hypothetical protein
MAKKTYFYKTKKGKIIAMEEREASLTGKFYEHIGTSDGTLFEKEIAIPKAEMNSTQMRMNEYTKLNRPVPDELYDTFIAKKLAFQDASTKGFELELEASKNSMDKPGNTERSELGTVPPTGLTI